MLTTSAVCLHYCDFTKFSGSENDEKAITAMGLLNTMETILTVMEDHEELHAQLVSLDMRFFIFISFLITVI